MIGTTVAAAASGGVEERRPLLHRAAAFLEQVAAGIRRFGWIADVRGERDFFEFTRRAGVFVGPRAECAIGSRAR